MSTQIDFARIVLLNRTKRELESANPVLLSGEASIADVGSVEPDLRFGDGVRPWTALPSFHARGIGGGIFAPFEVQNRINGHALFRVNDQIVPVGSSVIYMGPGEVGGTGYSILSIGGNTNGTVFNVWGSHNTQPGYWLANFHGSGWEPGDPAIPPGYLGPVPGTSNGLKISAGTNANDIALLVRNDANGGLGTYTNFLVIRGDGSGYLGPDEENCFFWDTTGWFQTRGTARFPGDAISELRDVSLASLRVGDTLEWNGSMWANVAPQRGTVTRIDTGTGLTGGPIFETGTIELANTSVTPGNYKVANFTVDAQGRLTHAESGSLDDLVDLHITDPVEGQVLEFDGEHWVNADHHVPELATLPDVALGELHEGQILTWNGLHWTNGDPAHNLGELTNVLLTDPRPGEHLIFDGENWVNAAGASVTMGTLAPIDPEPGYLWWDTDSGQLFVWFDDGEHGRWVIANNWQGGGGGASVTVNTSPPADPESGWLWWDAVGGQLYVWYDDGESAQWVIANSGNGGGGEGGGGASTLAELADILLTNPMQGQTLTWDATRDVWVNSTPPGGIPGITLAAGLAGRPVIVNPTGTGYTTSAKNQMDSINGSLSINGNAGGRSLFVQNETQTAGAMFFAGDFYTGIGYSPGVRIRAGGSAALTTPVLLVQDRSATTTFMSIFGTGELTAERNAGTGPSALFRGARVTGANGVDIRGGSSGTDWSLSVSNANDGGPFFRINADGSGYVGGNINANRMMWTYDGIFTVPTKDRQMVGLSVPIAYARKADSSSTSYIYVAITMPLTIPANFPESRALCATAPASTNTGSISKAVYSGGTWNNTQLGTIAFTAGSYVATITGGGGSLAAGDLLGISLPADATLDASITIHATRA